MEAWLAEVTAFQGSILGLNTAAVLLLYKMSRDIKDVTQSQKRHWHWIEKVRHELWPEAFPDSPGNEPHTDP